MNKLERILVPVDFSPGAKKALELALVFAERFQATIDVLHVLASWSNRPHAEQQLKELLLPVWSPSSLKVGLTIEEGEPAEKIVELAEKGGYELIVMSTHGRSGLEHLLMGSVAESVLRTAPCAVLVTR
jgi:universal stress protein A